MTTTAHKFLQLPDGTLGVYNAWDTVATALLLPELQSLLDDSGQAKYYHDWVEPLMWAVVRMQDRGLLVDRGRLNAYRRKVREELADCDQIILNADPTGDLRRPTSKYPNGIGARERLAKFLFQTLGLRSTRKTNKGFESTDQEAIYALLRNLRKKDEKAGYRDVLEALFHRSRLKTIYQRYVTIPTDDDGRCRPRVKMTATKTNRYAYEDPPAQQFPEEARHVFVATPGHTFVSVDYRQLEPRLHAVQAGDEVDLGIFSAGGDIYTGVAIDLFGDVMELTPESLAPKKHRNFAKSFRLGKGYGGKAETMKNKLFCPCTRWGCHDLMPDTLDLSPTKRKDAERRWERAHPAYRTFHRTVMDQVNRHHYWDCPLGGRRYVMGPWSRELEREMMNLPMQMTAAQLMRRRQVELDRLDAPIVMQIHDEFILEVPSSEVSYWVDTCREVMEAPVPELGGMAFPTDVALGDDWGNLEDQ